MRFTPTFLGELTNYPDPTDGRPVRPLSFVIRRMLSALLTLFVITILLFLVQESVPEPRELWPSSSSDSRASRP